MPVSSTNGEVSHTWHRADPYVAPGFKKFHMSLLDTVLVEAAGEDLTEDTTVL
jgi:hypothetical protein